MEVNSTNIVTTILKNNTARKISAAKLSNKFQDLNLSLSYEINDHNITIEGKKCVKDGEPQECPEEWAVNHSILQIVFACFVVANGIDGVRNYAY